MTDLTALREWLDRYDEAWRSNDAETVGSLFTADAVYRWHPWETRQEGATGRDEIVAAWLREPDDPSVWTLECEPLAVEGDLGVARCVTRYGAHKGEPAKTYHNIWLVRLTQERMCSEFTEYYMKEPRA